jgi:hypothetical protein
MAWVLEKASVNRKASSRAIESSSNYKAQKISFMQWKMLNIEKPPQSGTYLVSIMKATDYGQYGFRYLSHFDEEHNSWHQYDAFESTVGEEITDRIIAWSEIPPVFLG